MVLLVQDTTNVDLTPHPKTSGAGEIGNGGGRGLFLQTVLAIVPETGEVLGCALQEPFVRIPALAGESRETAVWMRLVERLGSFAEGTLVVHVGDRGADRFPFFQACQATHPLFLVRGFENRRLPPEEEAQGHLLDKVRSWPTIANRPLDVPANHRRTARLTTVHLAFGNLTVLPPRLETRYGKELLTLWAIRVWEEHTPAGKEPLEWILLTSVPTLTLEHAWERVNW